MYDSLDIAATRDLGPKTVVIFIANKILVCILSILLILLTHYGPPLR